MNNEQIIAALDAIHARMEQGENCFDDIGCLIAQAKGEYDPEEDHINQPKGKT